MDKKALDTLHNVKIAAILKNSGLKYAAVERLVQRVENAKLGAKAECDDDAVTHCFSACNSLPPPDNHLNRIYNMIIEGEMDELNKFTYDRDIDIGILISFAHMQGYEYFQYGVSRSIFDDDYDSDDDGGTAFFNSIM